MNEDTPDIIAKYSRLRDKLEEYSRKVADEVGEHHRLTIEAELLFMRAFDLVDDLEQIAAGLYSE